MDLARSPEHEEFRHEVRDWLKQNVPDAERPTTPAEILAFDREWQKRQYDGGWAGIDWPVEHGGRGLSRIQQIMWYEELVRADAPRNSVLLAGMNQIGRTIIAFGSEEQKATYLPRILTADDVWCQGFSEPDAGSDLASLRTRGRVEGDEIVISGQKIWNSFGHWATMCGALIRTDPDAARHKGLSWVVIPMDAPGVEVRPITTLDGGQHFAEIFFDEVRVPIGNVVGELHQGWNVAMGTLQLERGPTLFDQRLRLVEWSKQLIADARERGAQVGDDIMSRLVMSRAQGEAIRSMVYLMMSATEPGAIPGVEGMCLHVSQSQLRQSLARLGVDVFPEEAPAMQEHTRDWLWHFGSTLGGGSVDIQRNVIGERGLGLPRS